MKLIQELYGQGLVSEQKKAQLQAEIEKSQITEEDAILKNNIVGEDVLFELKSKILKVPLLKPKAEEVPSEVLHLVSEEAAVNYKMIPLFKKNGVVGVGMVYPENILAQNALRFLSQREHFNYKVYLITFSNLSQRSESSLVIDDAPIIKMVMVILRHAIEGSASDIHIEPGRSRLNIRFRQDGILHLSLFLPLSAHLAIVSRVKILANLKIDENRIPQDGRFSAKINNKDI